MKRLLVVGAAAAVLALPGCSTPACTAVGIFGLSVRVQDPTGAEVCDAVVTVTDGGYSEVLSAGGTAQDCAYVGALERSGTYTLTAKVGVVFGTGPSAWVRSDECHVITENVTIDLGA